MNNGTTFEPIFDTYGAASIADLALAPSDPNDPLRRHRRSEQPPDDVVRRRSVQEHRRRKDFHQHRLQDAQTLGRVIVHPRDPNTVWIAVGGHLYGPNPERGVFMTTDGGKTWTKTLYVDEYTSATEIVIDPSNPLNLWARDVPAAAHCVGLQRWRHG